MIWIAASALLNIAAGLLLKAAAGHESLQALKSGDVRVVGLMALAIAAYGGAFLGYFFAMVHLPLATAYLGIVALTAVGLSVASWAIWNESLSPTQIAGFVIVVVGLVALNKG